MSSMGIDGKPMPSLTFEHLPSTVVDVGALSTRSTGAGQEDFFVISPHDLMEAYLHTRFIPKGRDGMLQVTIEKSSVEYTHKRASNKFVQYINMGGLDVYDMRISVRLELLDNERNVTQTYVVNGQRIVEISEHASVAERERHQLQALEELFYELDGYILKVILGDMDLGIKE